MTAPTQAFASGSRSPLHHNGGASVKSLSENDRAAIERRALADVVIRALWESFPEAASEDELAELARPYFRNARTGEPISERTIKYWLRGETLPSALHLSALVMMQPRLFLGHWLGRAA